MEEPSDAASSWLGSRNIVEGHTFWLVRQGLE